MVDDMDDMPKTTTWKVVKHPDSWTIQTSDGECIARQYAESGLDKATMLAAAPDLVEALLNVRRLISEAAATGFNYDDGDWAEQLFLSQQKTSAAIEQALGVQMSNYESSTTTKPHPDKMTIRPVANGWIIQPGSGADEYTHIATSPDDLAKHVLLWAKAQSI